MTPQQLEKETEKILKIIHQWLSESEEYTSECDHDLWLLDEKFDFQELAKRLAVVSQQEKPE